MKFLKQSSKLQSDDTADTDTAAAAVDSREGAANPTSSTGANSLDDAEVAATLATTISSRSKERSRSRSRSKKNKADRKKMRKKQQKKDRKSSRGKGKGAAAGITTTDGRNQQDDQDTSSDPNLSEIIAQADAEAEADAKAKAEAEQQENINDCAKYHKEVKDYDLGLIDDLSAVLYRPLSKLYMIEAITRVISEQNPPPPPPAQVDTSLVSEGGEEEEDVEEVDTSNDTSSVVEDSTLTLILNDSDDVGNDTSNSIVFELNDSEDSGRSGESSSSAADEVEDDDDSAEEDDEEEEDVSDSFVSESSPDEEVDATTIEEANASTTAEEEEEQQEEKAAAAATSTTSLKTKQAPHSSDATCTTTEAKANSKDEGSKSDLFFGPSAAKLFSAANKKHEKMMRKQQMTEQEEAAEAAEAEAASAAIKKMEAVVDEKVKDALLVEGGVAALTKIPNLDEPEAANGLRSLVPKSQEATPSNATEVPVGDTQLDTETIKAKRERNKAKEQQQRPTTSTHLAIEKIKAKKRERKAKRERNKTKCERSKAKEEQQLTSSKGGDNGDADANNNPSFAQIKNKADMAAAAAAAAVAAYEASRPTVVANTSTSNKSNAKKFKSLRGVGGRLRSKSHDGDESPAGYATAAAATRRSFDKQSSKLLSSRLRSSKKKVKAASSKSARANKGPNDRPVVAVIDDTGVDLVDVCVVKKLEEHDQEQKELKQEPDNRPAPVDLDDSDEHSADASLEHIAAVSLENNANSANAERTVKPRAFGPVDLDDSDLAKKSNAADEARTVKPRGFGPVDLDDSDLANKSSGSSTEVRADEETVPTGQEEALHVDTKVDENPVAIAVTAEKIIQDLEGKANENPVGVASTTAAEKITQEPSEAKTDDISVGVAATAERIMQELSEVANAALAGEAPISRSGGLFPGILSNNDAKKDLVATEDEQTEEVMAFEVRMNPACDGSLGGLTIEDEEGTLVSHLSFKDDDDGPGFHIGDEIGLGDRLNSDACADEDKAKEVAFDAAFDDPTLELEESVLDEMVDSFSAEQVPVVEEVQAAKEKISAPKKPPAPKPEPVDDSPIGRFDLVEPVASLLERAYGAENFSGDDRLERANLILDKYVGRENVLIQTLLKKAAKTEANQSENEPTKLETDATNGNAIHIAAIKCASINIPVEKSASTSESFNLIDVSSIDLGEEHSDIVENKDQSPPKQANASFNDLPFNAFTDDDLQNLDPSNKGEPQLDEQQGTKDYEEEAATTANPDEKSDKMDEKVEVDAVTKVDLQGFPGVQAVDDDKEKASPSSEEEGDDSEDDDSLFCYLDEVIEQLEQEGEKAKEAALPNAEAASLPNAEEATLPSAEATDDDASTFYVSPDKVDEAATEHPAWQSSPTTSKTVGIDEAALPNAEEAALPNAEATDDDESTFYVSPDKVDEAATEHPAWQSSPTTSKTVGIDEAALPNAEEAALPNAEATDDDESTFYVSPDKMNEAAKEHPAWQSSPTTPKTVGIDEAALPNAEEATLPNTEAIDDDASTFYVSPDKVDEAAKEHPAWQSSPTTSKTVGIDEAALPNAEEAALPNAEATDDDESAFYVSPDKMNEAAKEHPAWQSSPTTPKTVGIDEAALPNAEEAALPNAEATGDDESTFYVSPDKVDEAATEHPAWQSSPTTPKTVGIDEAALPNAEEATLPNAEATDDDESAFYVSPDKMNEAAKEHPAWQSSPTTPKTVGIDEAALPNAEEAALPNAEATGDDESTFYVSPDKVDEAATEHPAWQSSPTTPKTVGIDEAALPNAEEATLPNAEATDDDESAFYVSPDKMNEAATEHPAWKLSPTTPNTVGIDSIDDGSFDSGTPETYDEESNEVKFTQENNESVSFDFGGVVSNPFRQIPCYEEKQSEMDQRQLSFSELNPEPASFSLGASVANVDNTAQTDLPERESYENTNHDDITPTKCNLTGTIIDIESKPEPSLTAVAINQGPYVHERPVPLHGGFSSLADKDENSPNGTTGRQGHRAGRASTRLRRILHGGPSVRKMDVSSLLKSRRGYGHC